MTDDRMALLELIEKAGDTDLGLDSTVVSPGAIWNWPRESGLCGDRSVQAHGSKGCRFADPAVTP
jgi:hypothetical protein